MKRTLFLLSLSLVATAWAAEEATTPTITPDVKLSAIRSGKMNGTDIVAGQHYIEFNKVSGSGEFYLSSDMKTNAASLDLSKTNIWLSNDGDTPLYLKGVNIYNTLSVSSSNNTTVSHHGILVEKGEVVIDGVETGDLQSNLSIGTAIGDKEATLTISGGSKVETTAYYNTIGANGSKGTLNVTGAETELKTQQITLGANRSLAAHTAHTIGGNELCYDSLIMTVSQADYQAQIADGVSEGYGILNIKDGATMHVGEGNSANTSTNKLQVFNGEVNIEGQASTLYLYQGGFLSMDSNYGGLTTAPDVNVAINITDGGQLLTADGKKMKYFSMGGGYDGNTIEATVSVEGKDSSMKLNTSSGLWFESSGKTLVEAVDGGSIELNSDSWAHIGTDSYGNTTSRETVIKADSGSIELNGADGMLIGSYQGADGNYIYDGKITIEATGEDASLALASQNGHLYVNQLNHDNVETTIKASDKAKVSLSAGDGANYIYLCKNTHVDVQDEGTTLNTQGQVNAYGAEITIGEDAEWAAGNGTIALYGGTQLHNDGTIKAGGMSLESGIVNNTGIIDVETLSMTGGVLNNAGTLNVKNQLDIAKEATLNCLAGSKISGEMPTQCTYAFTLSAKNLTEAGATLEEGTRYDTTIPLTLKLDASENLHAGKYMLLDASKGVQSNRAATPANVGSLTGNLGAKVGDIVWDDVTDILYFYLREQLLIAHDPLADAVQAANWGVYKSSQAFSSLLWAPRPNAVVVKSVETPAADGKGSIMTTEIEGCTLAWGSVYSSFSRNSGSGDFAGAEYSIFGAAIGVERQFARGGSIGVAFGYDWGKVSPFSTSRVEQESWHAALYGRAAEWKPGQKSSVALDWSAAVGSTTSEHKALGSDWRQENIQLDARATYAYALTERTAFSAFVGAQYYAQNDDSTERVEADSMQNLRLMLGGGISHKLTEKTTLFGEAMLFNDTMRHNPDVTLDGFEYGTGANPGRLGGSVTVGAQYQLTPNWTLRGSYTYEGADNSNEHRVNVGAVYSF